MVLISHTLTQTLFITLTIPGITAYNTFGWEIMDFPLSTIPVAFVDLILQWDRFDKRSSTSSPSALPFDVCFPKELGNPIPSLRVVEGSVEVDGLSKVCMDRVHKWRGHPNYVELERVFGRVRVLNQTAVKLFDIPVGVTRELEEGLRKEKYSLKADLPSRLSVKKTKLLNPSYMEKLSKIRVFRSNVHQKLSELGWSW
ncbi:hypothetical protein BGZ60DRAFT_425322 [Tricladium varicosporioides]|nr:hypothetical protein BGZ60DRAFT_425322 [Hymenoscyphus varicosporioides]